MEREKSQEQVAFSQAQTKLSLNNAEETFSILSDFLEKFIQVWESEDAPPALAEFLPEEDSETGELRRIVLGELIKIDLEYRWGEFNLPKRLDDYLREFPELKQFGVPVDLVYEEYHLRQQAGLNVDPQEYLEAFPQQAQELRCLLGLNTPYQSTSVYQPTSKQWLEELTVGQRIEDFDLLANLGEGAFAKVFLARQNSMQRLVALKVSADKGSEHQTLAQMDHDYIVRVFDLRTLPEQGIRLLYMQYVSGGTLHSVVEKIQETPIGEQCGKILLQAIDRALENRGETRPAESTLRQTLSELSWPATVCWLGVRLARALEYAHQRGILHRDVKPANVLLTAEGVPKLADFNISFSSKLAGATPAAYFGGSLAYMSPEQLEACNPTHERQPDSLDGRSDLYSLGVMLYELLAGARPFEDEKVEGSWSSTLQKMVERRTTGADFEHLPADTPPGLKHSLQTCLEVDSDDRWQSGAQLAQQLELCLKPAAEKLLHPTKGGLREKLLQWAFPLLLLFALLPNALAGWFNFVYNEGEIIAHLQESHDTFQRIQLIINGIAYPLGIALICWLGWPVMKCAKRLAVQPGFAEPASAGLRKQCLRLGHYLALISVAEWIIAGIAYPLSIHYAAGNMPTSGYLHFFSSLFLCGLIAAAYPFFTITCLSVRVLYPHLLQGDLSAIEDRQQIYPLRRFAWVYLISAMAVPMLSVLALVVIGSQNRFALLVLCTTALVGFLTLIIWLFRRLQNDLDALSDAFAHE